MNPLTYAGLYIFGYCSHCQVIPYARATQIDAFPAVNGVTSRDGGSRGSRIEIQGVLEDVDFASLASDLNMLVTYFDNVARTFTDSYGFVYPYVTFNGDGFHPSPEGPRPSTGGCALPYTLSGRSLT